MPFFAAKNLVSQELQPCVPWEFKPTEEITAQIRGDKEERQSWYQNQKTAHQFYTGIEPLNPNLRINKENNPPLILHAFTADFDLEIPDARVDEAVAAMEIKPTWIERSLGGNVRLVWVLEQPLRLDNYGFTAFLLDRAKKWLNLDMLPGLDENAFLSPTRLYCNGCAWRSTGHKPVPVKKSQAFLVDAAKRFRWPVSEDAIIPLDVVFEALKQKFPNMDWPEDFAVDSQGPSFWVPESTSPMSAIVKAGGMYSFSAHAEKAFTPWQDEKLLGKEFCKDFLGGAITKATLDTFFDSKKYWKKVNNDFSPMERPEYALHLKVSCKLSAKPGPSGVSQIEEALEFVHQQNRVKAALPFVFREPGLITFNGDRVLNIYNAQPLKPAAGTHHFGPHGECPTLSACMDTFFTSRLQFDNWLAWFQFYYGCALNHDPKPGQNVIMMGGVGIGKTLVNRFIVGAAVGGFVDASDFLIENIPFNSHLFKRAHWVLDDDTPANSPAALARMTTVCKKMAANQQFSYNEKFQVGGMLEFMGRIGITANLDFLSSRFLTGLDNNSLDKTSLFRCPPTRDFKFPPRTEMAKILVKELPYYLRAVEDWKVPDTVARDPRYGYAAYHEQTLLDQGLQTSPTAGFKECLIKTLDLHFQENATAPHYIGTVSDLISLMKTTNGEVLRSMKMEQAGRYLEQIQREGVFDMTTETGAFNVRLWKVKNFRAPVAPTPQPADSAPNEPNPFQK